MGAPLRFPPPTSHRLPAVAEARCPVPCQIPRAPAVLRYLGLQSIHASNNISPLVLAVSGRTAPGVRVQRLERLTSLWERPAG
ncbi:hypothetical protein NDU88_002533 [Pleurodeles waltl]|uniref:Uncharacterized protein n=1 Tax=Pleurodeles waltl TaxID=8319 RepID=A0AAV7T2N9_PLEWA|nr:hypothetical protein NDU88_002533 [Pleurodeles waltl]